MTRRDPFEGLGPPLGSWDLCRGSACGCAHCGHLARRLFVAEQQMDAARYSRLARGKHLDEDVILDLLGYLVLLRIAQRHS